MSLNRSENQAAGVVVGAVSSGVVAWLANWLSDKYSTAQIEQLKKIKDLYMVELGATTDPDIFILDNGYPKAKYLDSNVFSIQAGRANDNRAGSGNYFANSSYLMDTIEAYLKGRSKRLLGRGKKGDVLALVLIEWLNWANNDLPQLKYDKSSFILLEKRRNYLSKIIKENYFTHSSWYRRGNTKFDTFLKMQSILNGCIEICREEEKKQSVRDYLSVCRDVSVKILNKALSICYLTCDQLAHTNAFNTLHFSDHSIDSYAQCSISEWSIYSRILQTDNGKILHEIVARSGLSAPGFPKFNEKPTTTDYYDISCKAITFNPKPARLVFYPWNKHKPADAKQNCKDLQYLGEVMLEFVELLDEVELSYNIVGGRGDHWVSQPAKQDFLELLIDTEASLRKLITQFVEFLKKQDRPRDLFNHAHSINGDTDWNSNFTLITKKLEEIEKISDVIYNAINQIRNIIGLYPISSEKLTVSELAFSNRRRKRKGEVLLEIEAVHQSPDYASIAANLIQRLEVTLAEIQNLHLPVSIDTDEILSFDKPGLVNFKSKPRPAAELHFTTSLQWANEFLTLHKDFFEQHADSLTKLTLAIQEYDAGQLSIIQKEMTDNFNQMLATINQEKPQWRFKYYIVPVSVGWPFHSAARQFADLLSAELTTTLQNTTEFIKKTNQELLESLAKQEHTDAETSALLHLAQAVRRTNFKALNTSSQFITNRMLKAERDKERLQAFLNTIVTQSKIAPSVTAATLKPTLAELEPLIQFNTFLYDEFFGWQNGLYKSGLVFFPLNEDILSKLQLLLKALDEINKPNNSSASLITIRDDMFIIQKQLDACVSKLPNGPRRTENEEQLELMRHFLKICLELDKEARARQLVEFKNVCSRINLTRKVRFNLTAQLTTSHSSPIVPVPRIG